MGGGPKKNNKDTMKLTVLKNSGLVHSHFRQEVYDKDIKPKFGYFNQIIQLKNKIKPK
jgi:hypothetical protein